MHLCDHALQHVIEPLRRERLTCASSLIMGEHSEPLQHCTFYTKHRRERRGLFFSALAFGIVLQLLLPFLLPEHSPNGQNPDDPNPSSWPECIASCSLLASFRSLMPRIQSLIASCSRMARIRAPIARKQPSMPRKPEKCTSHSEPGVLLATLLLRSPLTIIIF